MSVQADFVNLVKVHGSTFIYQRQQSLVACPCRTLQGFRDDLWHRTDQPGLPILTAVGAGNLTGTYTYRVHNNYAQGEKTNVGVDIALVGEKVLISWNAADSTPPAGRGPAISYLIYRMLQPSGAWHLVTEIADLTQLSYEDDALDAALIVQDPILSVCNQAGYLVSSGDEVTLSAKGFIQPVQSGAVRRLTTEVITEMFGEVEADDHLGILPVEWAGVPMDFSSWGESLEDRIIYNGRSYTVVSANLIPNPEDGNPAHHWEVGLRLI